MRPPRFIDDEIMCFDGIFNIDVVEGHPNDPLTF